MPGPSTHIYIINEIFDSLSQGYDIGPILYGSIAPDCDKASPFDLLSREDTHNGFQEKEERIAFCEEMLSFAENQDEEAFVLGYLTHLSADAQWYWNVYKKFPDIRQHVLKAGVDAVLFARELIPEFDYASAILSGKSDKVLVRKLEEDGIDSQVTSNALLLRQLQHTGIALLERGAETMFNLNVTELLLKDPPEACREIVDGDLCNTVDYVLEDVKEVFG